MDINENDLVRHSETKVFYRVKRITTIKLEDLNIGRDRLTKIDSIEGGKTKTLYTIENCYTGQVWTVHQLMMRQFVNAE